MDGVLLAPIGVLLLVACLIAMLTRRLGLPYIVGLVVAGFLIALLPSTPDLPLSRALIFNVLLPPLVFEASLQLDWRRFRRELPLTITLAFLGVCIAAAVVAATPNALTSCPWERPTTTARMMSPTTSSRTAAPRMTWLSEALTPA